MIAGRQFLLLIWKNALLMKRHWIITIFEILIPLIAIIFFVYLRSLPGDNLVNTEKQEHNATISNPYDPLYSLSPSYGNIFLFTPNNHFAKLLTDTVVQKFMNIKSAFPSHGFDNEDQLRAEATFLQNNQSMYQYMSIFGLVYNNLEVDNSTPSSLDYKISVINRSGKMNTDTTFLENSAGVQTNADSGYLTSNFLGLQAAVDLSFIELQNKSSNTSDLSNINLMLQEFPYPPYSDQTEKSLNLLSLLPLFFVSGFAMMMVVFVKRILQEKTNRAKEMMRMMGLNDMVYFGGTFFHTFAIFIVLLSIATVLFKIPMKDGESAVNKTNGFILWILFVLYAANTLLFAMFQSTFFNNAVIGSIASVIINLVSYDVPVYLMDPPGMVNTKYFQWNLSQKLAVGILPNMALHWGIRIISFYEGIGQGVNWENINQPPPSDDMSLSLVMGMMVASSLVYCVLIWYVDNVWPWQFGIPKHPLYLFMPSYWFPKKSNKGEKFLEETRPDLSYFEDDPTDRKPGITLSNLSKMFGWGSTRKIAVNNLTLNMYEGQITALLGHNGAGKTTAMNVITGLFPPSAGTAVVNGYNILTNLKQARRSLGLCPQHNVLYDNLTVEEHLKFFAGLKGRTFAEMKPEIESCLTLLQLQIKRNDLAKTLSGGMKRKLSLGIAMIGDSQVLILDEPTAGMDTQARRAIWDLLQQIRENRTIVLTTHYMEEADILGDRIAIMAEGTIQCCGSPLFLKRKFGAGYHLRVTKGDTFKESAMTAAIQRSVPSAYVDTNMRTELAYILPVVSSETFVAMFETLEAEKKDLGFTACGMTITTMEDVFIKVGQLAEKSAETVSENGDSRIHHDEIANSTGFQVKAESRLVGGALFFQQVRGLLLKRVNDARRYVFFLIFLIFLPLIIIFLMLYVRNLLNAKPSHQSNNQPPLKLDLERVYGETKGFYQNNNLTTPFGKAVLSNYIDLLGRAGATPNYTDDIQSSVISEGIQNINTYKTEILVGGSVNQNGPGSANVTFTLTAMYSSDAYHASAMSLNLMDTALLRAVTGNDNATISVTNYPFPNSDKQSLSELSPETELSNRMMIDAFFPLALAFLSSSFVLFPIHERQTKSKLLQLMSGVNGLTFWLTHFICDFAMFFLSACFMLIPFGAMDTIGAYSSYSLGTLFLMLLLYGWSAIPLAYLLSFISKKPSTGFVLATSINFITGMMLTLAVTIYKMVAQTNTTGPEKLAFVFRLSPTFAFTWGAASLDSASTFNVYCKNVDQTLLKLVCIPGNTSSVSLNPLWKCCKPEVCGDMCFTEKSLYTMDEDSCGRDMLFLCWTGFLFFALLAFLESNYIMRLWYRIRDSKSAPSSGEVQTFNHLVAAEDSDVAAERTRVDHLYEQGRGNQEALLVHNLTKFFGNINAVDRVTFSVHQNECFGLLGVNGAGKTTTFSMLTGDLAIGGGTALIGNYNIRNQLKEFQQQVGYCPQFDALLDRLTGRESLYLFARLRGVPEHVIREIVPKLINVVDLQAHADKTADKYSGGNRRKLSLALALVGSPPVVFLDEPTAGVDPASRRKIWNAFIQVQLAGGTSFILTTHSMEESEALCGRLVIMVNGSFRCLGPIQYLKSKFGQGYTIIVKLNKEQHLDPNATEAVKQFFEVTFPGSVLKDLHQGMLHYHILDTGITWSKLFREMERAKKTFNLEDYLISDTTLEQIFLAFARTQRILVVPS